MPDIRPHYFIGVPIPEGIANPIYQAAKNEPLLTFQKWVHPLDYHITLIFLGAADETQIKKLEGSLAEIASEIDPFSIEFGKIDVFGDRKRPRVLHLEPKKNNTLERLREHTKQAVLQAGFQVEKRPYHPHMTLARKWTGEEGFPAHVPFESGEVSMRAERFSLFQIHLNQSPKYEEIFKFHLS
ncbi:MULTISPECIES: RNA 2',3'-cyclic phosphodiesterase [Bacillus]|uniref:RNA 2',3'-cyclic phosphodiesterase n=1 Tax=Bacillus TaxID=1386 RepID=UPI00155A3B13|nr:MULTISPECIES: RNA 2',3'-cyclic phosphodiesterase [Bacillus]MDL9995008.1 RNA 2',3'-cyclic phosphodiesterase [Bacillus stercoris]MDN0189477.1 RNA 2',3'-cyclic phosphodiesterase [Bacillus sp. B.PNR1]MDN3034477.1 RNA 2',3'-cyclic phosphodiesterase [Bacillus sp. B.PNR2]NLS87869.1 RNA 2',3'-cyclic phosphodiesterase [Bacillus subtilis]